MKKNIYKFFGILLFLFILSSCKEDYKYVNTDKEKSLNKIEWAEIKQYYLTALQESIDLLSELELMGFDHPRSSETFRNIRIAWKKAEPFAAYLNPEVGHRINGPALPVFMEDSESILPPVGLQKIEESIFNGRITKEQFKNEVEITKGMMIHLRETMMERDPNPDRFFISVHQQLLRIISFSISGFDTPVSSWGISEAAVSLESLGFVYKNSIRAVIHEENPELDAEFLISLEKSVSFLENNNDFKEFDRFIFIRDYFNPMMANWVRIIEESRWKADKHSVFNFKASTFFQQNSFNVGFFMPSVNQNFTSEQEDLGKKLFFDKKLSENGLMSCASCHIPEKAFADGMLANLDNSGNLLERNTPTLLNVIFQQSFFWDGRSGNIMDQITAVFENTKEFDSGVHQFSDKILIDDSYEILFQNVYGKVSQRNNDVIKALAAYIATLNGFDSKFDRNIRNEEETFTTKEKLGFNIFMGKGLCATCHFIPLTNGTVPPFYKESEKEVIGVPETSENLVLDDDYGIFWQYGLEFQKGMFKTPTIRNSDITAPYMHNGVYKTLEQVIDFYDSGGGVGLGFDLSHQTLPPDSLDLKQEEKEALLHFIKTLTDYPLN